MILAARDCAWLIATVCTVASVVGGAAGYGIGALLFDTIGRPIVEFYGYMDSFQEFQVRYEEWGAWLVAAAGFMPFPYKVITIPSAVMHSDFGLFTIALVLSRGARFFLVAALLWYFGPQIRSLLNRSLQPLPIPFFAATG